MKRSKHLLRRDKIYYLRFPKPISDIRVSLQTYDFYEACYLRDKVFEVILGNTMNDYNEFQVIALRAG